MVPCAATVAGQTMPPWRNAATCRTAQAPSREYAGSLSVALVPWKKSVKIQSNSRANLTQMTSRIDASTLHRGGAQVGQFFHDWRKTFLYH